MQSSSSAGFARGLGGPPGRDLRPCKWVPFLPFQRPSGRLSTLLPSHRPCLWGRVWTRPRPWCLISLPCWFVAQFTPGPWLITVPTESQAVPPAENWHSTAPPALLTADLALFLSYRSQPLPASPPHPCLAMAPHFVKGQSTGAQGMNRPQRTQDEHWAKGGSGRAGGK